MTISITNTRCSSSRLSEPARHAARASGLLALLLAVHCDGARIGSLELDADGARCYTATGRVNDMSPTPDGGVLVASEGGLLHYDRDRRLSGKLTRADGLAGHTLQSLATAPDGAVWIASLQGVTRLREGRLTSYRVQDGLNDDRAYAVAVDAAGRVLVGTHRGVSRLEGDRFVTFDDTHEFSRRPTYDIHAAADGTLWFAKENALTQYLGDRSWRVFQRDPVQAGPRSDIVSNSVRLVVTDRRGNPWVGTADRGLGYFDDHSWTHLAHRERGLWDSGMRDNRVAALAIDRAGDLWVGHGDAAIAGRALGVARVRDHAWRYYTQSDGLPGDQVYRVRIDSSGDAWIATSRGVAHHSGERFDVYHTPGELPSNRVLQLAALAPDTVAVLTSAGLALFREGEEQTIASLPFDDWTGMGASGGQLYLGTLAHGLWRLDGESWTKDPSFSNGPIQSLTSGADEVWVLDARGLQRGAAGSWRTFAASPARPGSRIFPGPGGRVWVSGAGPNHGLAGFEGGRVRFRAVRRQPFLAHVGYAADGTAWLAADDGLIDLDHGRKLAPAGLADFVPRVTAVDSRGRLWVGTRNHGLLRYDGATWALVLLNGQRLPLEITDLCFEGANFLWVGTAGEGALRIAIPEGDGA